MACGSQHILGVTSIESPAHAAHESGDSLAGFQPAVRRVCNLAHTFYPRDNRLLDICCIDLRKTEYLFRVVHAEGFYLYEDPAGADLWERDF